SVPSSAMVAHSLAGHSPAVLHEGGRMASGVVIPTQYSPGQYSQSQPPGQFGHNAIPVGRPVLPPAPVASQAPAVGGHSWGNVPPAAIGGQPITTDPSLMAPPMTDLGWSDMLASFDPTIDNPNVIRIPIRLGPGERPNITEDLITLYDGDIVF